MRGSEPDRLRVPSAVTTTSSSMRMPVPRSSSVSEVTVHGVYGAFMEHTIYMVVEADDFTMLNKFLLPGMKVCSTEITPVSAEPLPSW